MGKLEPLFGYMELIQGSNHNFVITSRRRLDINQIRVAIVEAWDEMTQSERSALSPTPWETSAFNERDLIRAAERLKTFAGDIRSAAEKLEKIMKAHEQTQNP
jgi:hypothetical protein